MTATVGTASDVVRAFLDNRAMRTRVAPVPGGTRVSVDREMDGRLSLYSYRTIVAVRMPDGRVAITGRKYSVTTSELVGHIVAAAYREGYRETGTVEIIRAAVPGRHGGYGIPWHPTGYELLPFEVMAQTANSRYAKI